MPPGPGVTLVHTLSREYTGEGVVLAPTSMRRVSSASMLSFLQGWLNSAAGNLGKDALGDRGENRAARYLRERGYKILIRNFRCPLGEIDIVARDGRTIVFCEVKTRAEDNPRPEEQVNGHKQHQITKAAKSADHEAIGLAGDMLASIATAPFVAIVTTLLFYDLVARRERLLASGPSVP